MIYDIVIIGSGPAGLTAAIYAQRAKRKALVIEKQMIMGGQVINTEEVDNYPGMPGITGMQLAEKMHEHAKKLNAEFKTAEVASIDVSGDIKVIDLGNEKIETKTVILATGTQYRHLGVAGEEELTGMGVSYCATCDAAFFKNKTTAVIGGGDVALEDALVLARICEKVYLIHRRNEFRGAKILQEHVKNSPNIELIMDAQVEEICGEDQVEAIKVHSNIEETVKEYAVDGVFVAVGIEPNTAFVKGQVALDELGYIVAGEDCKTSVSGVYAAGDVRKKPLRQIITAAADGANAVTSIENDLHHM